MDYIVIKTSSGLTLESGNTVYMAIQYLPSADNSGKIVDVGINIQVNKKNYHSYLMAKIEHLVQEANKELLKLNLEYQGQDINTFNAKVLKVTLS